MSNLNLYTISNGELYTVEETASVLKCKVNTLYTWSHERKIKATKSGGKLLFLGKDIKAFLGLDLKEELGTNNARIKTESPKEISGIKTLSPMVKNVEESSASKATLKIFPMKKVLDFNTNNVYDISTNNHKAKEVQACL